MGQLKIVQLLTGQLVGALPERGGGDVMHQLGEGQWVGGGPAAAAHRLQRETKQVRDFRGFICRRGTIIKSA